MPNKLFTALLISFSIGFLSLSQEILWLRIVSYKLKGLPQSFSFVLAFFLIGLSLGAHVGQKFCVQKKYNIFKLTALVIYLAGLFDLILPSILGKFIINLNEDHDLKIKFELINIIYLSIFITASSFLKGIIFPIVHHIASEINSKKISEKVSLIYFMNIMGSTAGPIVTGFYLLNFISTEAIFLFIGLSGLILGTIILSLFINLKFIFFIPFFIYFFISINFKKTNLIKYLSDLPKGHEIVNLIENRQGIIFTSRLKKKTHENLFIFGGNVIDGSNNFDLFLDNNLISRVYLLTALHENPERILVIGLGGGSWVKVMSKLSSAKSIDVVEINPGYINLIKNDKNIVSILNDNRINIHIDDARKWLKKNSSKKYDLIVMNSTYHWRSNTSNLLSEEFISIIKKNLNIKGIFAYNATGSIDSFYTTSENFNFSYRYSSLIYASDYDFNLNASDVIERIKNLKQNYANNKLSDNENQAIESTFKNFNFTKFEQDLILIRRKPEIITDKNMLTEYKFGMINVLLSRYYYKYLNY